MQPIGYNGLEGRSGFKLAIKQHQGRWYLYTASGGLNVLDVTDPAFLTFAVSIFLESKHWCALWMSISDRSDPAASLNFLLNQRFLKRLSLAARWNLQMRAFSFAEFNSNSAGPS